AIESKRPVAPPYPPGGTPPRERYPPAAPSPCASGQPRPSISRRPHPRIASELRYAALAYSPYRQVARETLVLAPGICRRDPIRYFSDVCRIKLRPAAWDNTRNPCETRLPARWLPSRYPVAHTRNPPAGRPSLPPLPRPTP